MRRNRNKYGNKSLVVNGIKYDSKKELRVLNDIVSMEKGGLVRDVVFKTTYTFEVNGEPIRYISDKVNKDGSRKLGRILTWTDDVSFYDCELGYRRIIDVKGFQTDVFKMKRALMKAVNGIDVELW